MVLVIGTGRSGTSLTAGALHHLGFDMGSRFLKVEPTRPWGDWEDLDFKEPNQGMLEGKISPDVFRKGLEVLIKKKREPWGMKHPGVVGLLPFYRELIPQMKIIWCVRDREASVLSMRKAYGWSRTYSEGLYDFRWDLLRKVVPDPGGGLKVWYEKREQLVDKLCDFLDVPPTEEAWGFVH